jgi:formate hydrogenlyase transcriptional activator
MASGSTDGMLEFEELLAEVSTRFVNLPAGEVDEQIENGLKRIVSTSDVDRATLYQFTKDKKELRATHSWAVEGIERVPGVVADERWPYAVGLLRRGGTWQFSRLEEVPGEATAERQYFEATGIRSGLAIPLQVGEQLVGALSMVTFRQERPWPTELVQRLRMLGEAFANALIRKRFEEDLSAEKQFSASVIESLPGLFFMMDEESRYIRWNKNIEDLMGYSAEVLPNTLALSTVSPKDRSRATKAVEEGFRKGQTTVEYLQIMKDGQEVPHLATAKRATIGGKNYLLGLNIDISARKEAEDALRKAYSEIETLKEQLQSDYTYLKEEIDLDHNPEQIIGQSKALKYVLFKVKQIATTNTTVLILGETGSGKELLARAIHNGSPRQDRPLVKVNCAVLPANLIESELFGHEKGAFTGAHARQAGRFEVANGTTLFLDEIGELPLELQAKLLRVIEHGEFERLGSTRTIKVDVRVISATNRNLEEEVRKGRFREDLWYRLSVFPITVPPLRERQEDIPLLVQSFVKRIEKKIGREIRTIPKKTMQALQEYPWPGNIRELENVIERAVISSTGPSLRLADRLESPETGRMRKTPRKTLEEVERDHIIQTLEETNWRISGESGAARILGLHHNTLRGRMKKLGISAQRVPDRKPTN